MPMFLYNIFLYTAFDKWLNYQLSSYNDHFLSSRKMTQRAKKHLVKVKLKWVERDSDGRPIPKRSRSGETRMRASATGILCLSRLIWWLMVNRLIIHCENLFSLQFNVTVF